MAALQVYDAVVNNDLPLLKRLTNQYKIDLNAKFVEYRNKNHVDLCPIHLAAYRGYTYMLQYLIESRCDVNQNTATLRRTALHFAVQSHKMACMLLLISAGAKIDAQDTFGNSPCHYAADDGYSQILDVLIRRGVDVNARDITSKTPLMKSVRNNKIDTVLRLIRADTDTNVTDRNNDVALHFAARNGCADIVDILIQAGSKTDIQNYWGRTPVMEAVCYNHKEVINRLILANCDKNCKEFKSGDTALHISIKRNYMAVTEILLTSGSRHDVFNHQGETAVYDAVISNKLDIIRLMLMYNCDLDVPGKYFSNDGVYKSVFQLAAEKGHLEVCRFLTTYGHIDYTATTLICGDNFYQGRGSPSDQDDLLFLRLKMHMVMSLQQLCRKVIRKRLSYQIIPKLEVLNIPQSLKDYVLIKELLEEDAQVSSC